MSLSQAPASRAAALSAPAIEPPVEMRVHAGDTADQTVHATDVDGDPLTFSVYAASPSYMSVTTTDPGSGSATGLIHLAPSSRDTGTATGTVAIYDGVNYRIASFGIAVFPYLEPVADMTVNEGETADQTLIAIDSPGHVVSFTISGYAPFASLTATSDTTATLHLAPDFNASGPYDVTISIADSMGMYSVPIRIVVNNTIRPPVLEQPSDMHAVPGTVTEQGISASDPDGLGLTFYKAAGPAYMSVGTFGGLPRRGYVRLDAPAVADTGEVSGTVGVTNTILTDEKSFQIRVDLQNAPPTIVSLPDIDIPEGTDFRGSIVGIDPDGQRLNFNTSQLPPFMAFTPQTQPFGGDTLVAAIRLDPGFDDAGSYSVVVRLSDGRDEVADTLHITVREAGNRETSLRLSVLSSGITTTQKYSALDGVFRVSVRQGGVLAFSFTDTLGSGAHWDFPFSPAEEGSYTTTSDVPFFIISGSDSTAPNLVPCAVQATTFQIRRIARALDGTVLSFWATFQQVCSAGRGFSGDMRYLMPGFPLTVVAPTWVLAGSNQTVAFNVTASDSANDAATLSATGLPGGSTFVVTGSGRGTFTWTPTRIAAGDYVVEFIATGAGGQADTASTNIHVVSVDQPPRAFANGPYFGKVGVPIAFSSTGSSDPEGDSLTYHWSFGDGQLSNSPFPLHAYGLPGPYSVTLLVSDGLLVGGDVTLARITWPDSASATQVHVVGAPRPIHLQAGDGHFCVALETVDVPSSIVDMDPFTLRMIAKGLGSTDAVPADPASIVLGDANGNGVPDVTACFGSESLRPLFSQVRGSLHVLTTIEFKLHNGQMFRASLPLDVIAPDGSLRPLLAPNPFRVSGTFSFVTTAEGVARLWLFDSHGRRVRTLLDVPAMPTGYHDVPIDTRDENDRPLPSGVYFYRLETKEGTRTGRLALIR